MKTCCFPVAYAVLRHAAADWRIPTRTIPNHELVFVLEGELEIRFEGKKAAAKPGTLLYFRPGRPHSLKAAGGPAYFCAVHFEAGEDALPLPDAESWTDFHSLLPMLEEVVRLWNRRGYLDGWAADLAFSRLLLELFRRRENDAIPSSRRKIAAAIAYIHEDPVRPVTIAALCALTGMKKSHLIRSFRLVTGQSPIQYALNLRLERARAILLNEPVTVKEAAYRCGFRDEFYFSRLFRSRYGLSPAQYRQNT